ncbi:glycosyltransferase [Vibrio vulnificus]|nr:glycosyltransferase [Vibrio vulnificus]EIH0731316.1 glycosyltransferase [Vibrio vulnificus]EIH1436764.1 glycosyltransferase [Vibrio vulnificus]
MKIISRDNTCVVMTTFMPTDTVRENITNIAHQVDRVIVVDDTGSSSHAHLFDLDDGSTIYIHNTENLGIAKALNVGFSKAKELGYQWVLTLDDDTKVGNFYLDRLSNYFTQRPDELDEVGIVTLSRNEPKCGESAREKRTLITSGSLQSIENYQRVGGFDESYFIDLVDFDYCVRMRRLGKKLIELPEKGMEHKVGCTKIVSFFGLSITVFNHSPFRLYYQVRNVFIFSKVCFKIDPILATYMMLDIIRIPMKAMLFENNKLARAKFIMKGLLDGVFGKSGGL